jgi:gas vesicle protein
MFKLLKFLGIMSIGMLFAPKKGSEIREDLVKYLNTYKPQLKKLIVSLEDTWEKAKSSESDEVALEVETRLANVREAAVELDAAKTKELAYKALAKIGETSIKIGKGVVKSPNFIAVTKDLALISVNALDQMSNVYSKVKDVSTSIANDVAEPSELDKASLISSEESMKREEIKTGRGKK